MKKESSLQRLRLHFQANETCVQIECTENASREGYCVQHRRERNLHRLEQAKKEARTGARIIAQLLASRKLALA